MPLHRHPRQLLRPAIVASSGSSCSASGKAGAATTRWLWRTRKPLTSAAGSGVAAAAGTGGVVVRPWLEQREGHRRLLEQRQRQLTRLRLLSTTTAADEGCGHAAPVLSLSWSSSFLLAAAATAAAATAAVARSRSRSSEPSSCSSEEEGATTAAVTTTPSSSAGANSSTALCDAGADVDAAERQVERDDEAMDALLLVLPPGGCRYQLEGVLGEGAYGSVYKATRERDGRVVALKEIDASNSDSDDFQREVRALRRLSLHDGGNGHPNVCRLYDTHVSSSSSSADDDGNASDNDGGSKEGVGSTSKNNNNYFYLVMELIEGGELLELLLRHGPYSEARASTFVRQIADAVAFVHRAGVVHGDIKPENLMMSSSSSNSTNVTEDDEVSDDEQATVKVVDFGSAVLLDDEASSTDGESGGDASEEEEEDDDDILGTIAYSSPELLRREKRLRQRLPSTESDMWAIGCVVYILVTGSHPFDKYADKTDEDIVKSIQEIPSAPDAQEQYMTEHVFDDRVEGLSDSCVRLMKLLLQPDPQRRMTSDEFVRNSWVQGLDASRERLLEEGHRNLEAFWQKRFRMEILRLYGRHIKANGDEHTGDTGGGGLSDANLTDIFKAIDLNGDGVLSPKEIEVVFRGLGMSADDTAQVFASADLDGSGSIDLDEFKAIMRKGGIADGPGVRIYHRQLRFKTDITKKFLGGNHGGRNITAESATCDLEQLRKIFNAIDDDKNGVLDPHELRAALHAAGETDEDRISEIVASVDLGRDGFVTWDEFCKAMCQG